jgi:spore germination cell wall hydrolase CwlJ-like protein
VFFASAQSVSGTYSVLSTTESTTRVTKSYTDDKKLSNKQDDATTEKAKTFDDAKQTAQKTAKVIEKAAQAAQAKQPAATVSTSGKYLLDIANPDANYVSYSVSLSDYDRDILERLVMGEAGGEGFIGCCLVAQAIRDTMISDGYKSVEALRTSMGYYGGLYNTPNEDALNAVKFIFDEGGAAVQHNIVYFYAPALCTSGFHESQEFVVAHNSHRFFDRW